MANKSTKLLFFAGILLLSTGAFAITAKDFRAKMMANPNIVKAEGEAFSWNSTYGIAGFIQGYYAYNKDPKWLEEASTYYDYQISRMVKEPDGYMGWVGPYFGMEPKRGSVVVGDANLLDHMLEFSEIVMKNDSLKKSPLGKKAEEYIALARSVLIDKWDKRGGYYEDGPFMSYLSTGIYISGGKLESTPGRRNSENLNKHSKMGVCFLKLYRITGEQMFKDRAEKIFSHYKAIFRYHKSENRYFWNFWEPLAPFDFKPEGDNSVSWIAVHPARPGYQSAECEFITEAYHTGVVFSEDDMKKIINTNLWMWNKDLSSIHFKSSDGTAKTSNYDGKGGQDCGCLWPSLADFDQKIRDIYAVQLKKGRNNELEMDYFNKVICREKPSFKRKYVTGEVTLPDIPVLPSTEIIMAIATPGHINVAKGEKMKLACKGAPKVTGPVTVSLVSEDRKKVICEIGKIQLTAYKDMYGVNSMSWNGRDNYGAPLKGNYRVRFAKGDSTREWPVSLE